jgi:hypothetical protein
MSQHSLIQPNNFHANLIWRCGPFNGFIGGDIRVYTICRTDSMFIQYVMPTYVTRHFLRNIKVGQF